MTLWQRPLRYDWAPIGAALCVEVQLFKTRRGRHRIRRVLFTCTSNEVPSSPPFPLRLETPPSPSPRLVAPTLRLEGSSCPTHLAEEWHC